MEKLKYTTYQIADLVQKEATKYGSIDALSTFYNVDKEIVKIILKTPLFLSLEMYKTASVISNKTIKELTEIEECSALEN